MPELTPAKRLRVYIGEADRHGGRPLSQVLLGEARTRGIAGCTVLRAVAGYGGNQVVHGTHLIEVEGDLPEVVEFVDAAERIDVLLDAITPLLRGGAVTVEPVTWARFGAR